MAITTQADWKIYPEQFNSGVFESIAQQTNAFNGPSANAIRLIQRAIKGNFGYNAFFKDVDLISRRDVDSTSALTPVTLTQDEIVSVKINRTFGPVEMTLDALKKSGHTPEEISFILGQKVGEQKVQDWLNTGVLAAKAALLAQAPLKHDITGETTKTVTHAALVGAQQKLGDAASKLVAWVMHSKVYADLLQGALTDKIVNVADMVIYQGNVATLGRPVIVTDSPSLILDDTTDTYYTLGLQADGIVVAESEEDTMNSQLVNGKANIVLSVQGEHAYNLQLKGFGWDVTNGGKNPADAAVGTGSNWDLKVANAKNAAGVILVSQ